MVAVSEQEAHGATSFLLSEGEGFRVVDPPKLEGTLRETLAHKAPVLVDVVSARQELVMPPKATLDHSHHFGLFTLKAVIGRPRDRAGRSRADEPQDLILLIPGASAAPRPLPWRMPGSGP